MRWNSPTMGCGAPQSAVSGLAEGPSLLLAFHGRFMSCEKIEGMKVSGNQFVTFLDTSRVGVYALVHPRKLVCFLLLSPL